MIASATQKPSSLAKRTKLGEDHNAFPRNGFATAILIALTELMKTQRCITVQHLNPARMISLLTRTAVASTKDGLVIMTMIVAMDLTKENSVTLNTRLARRKSSLARTSNASGINIDAVRQEI